MATSTKLETIWLDENVRNREEKKERKKEKKSSHTNNGFFSGWLAANKNWDPVADRLTGLTGGIKKERKIYQTRQGREQRESV